MLSQRAEEIAGIVTEETGGVFGWGMFNVELAAGMLREAAAQAYWLTGEVIPSDVPGKLAMGVRQPAGVVVAIAPWNAPVILAPAPWRRRWRMGTPWSSRRQRCARARMRQSSAL